MIARQNRGEVLAASGDLAAARTAFEGTSLGGRARRIPRGCRERPAAYRRVAIRQRDWDEADRQLAAARPRGPMGSAIKSSLLYDRGRLALGRGDLPAAERLFSSFLAPDLPDDRLIRYTVRPPRAGLGRQEDLRPRGA